jgi:hypothetical protein
MGPLPVCRIAKAFHWPFFNPSPTESGAVQSLTDAAFARVVVGKLRGPTGSLPPFYQIVIRISYRGGTAVNSFDVTHRALTVARNSIEPLVVP